MTHRCSEAGISRREFLGAVGVGVPLTAVGRCLFLGQGPATAQSGTIDALVGRPTARSAALSVIPPFNQEYVVEWGQDLEAMPEWVRTIRGVAGTPNVVTLDGLQPSTRYQYRVRSISPPATGRVDPNQGVFSTQRPPGESFVFTVTADSHLVPGRTRAVTSAFGKAMALLARETPDFHVTLGDDALTHARSVIVNDSKAADAVYANFRRMFAPITSRAALFQCIGNHEGEGWIDESFGLSRKLAALSRAARLKHIPNPEPETYPEGGGKGQNYFAWSWGDALFVAIDPYPYSTTRPRRPEDWTLGAEQMAWLMRTLQTSTQKWKILFQHQLIGGSPVPANYGKNKPYYNYGRGGAAFAHVGEQAAIQRLLVEHGGQIVFKGHDHVYADESVGGVHYTTGTRFFGKSGQPRNWAKMPGGAELYPAGYDLGIGYLRVTVSPKSLRVEYVASEGKTRGGYVIDG